MREVRTVSGKRTTLLGVVLALALLVSGCLGAQPSAQPTGGPSSTTARPSRTPESRESAAQKTLLQALDTLAGAPAVRYDGRLSGPDGDMDVDLRITQSGVVRGHIRDRGGRIQLLAVSGSTFIKAGKKFWNAGAGSDGADAKTRDEKVAYFARHWVKIDPNLLGDPATTLRPKAMAERLADDVRSYGVSEVAQGTTNGHRVQVVTSAGSTYHVTTANPARLVKVESPRLRLSGRASRAAVRVQAGEETGGEETEAPLPGLDGDGDAGNGLELDELDAPEIDDLYDEVEDEVRRRLKNAIDSQVRFNARATGQMQCPGGVCTLNVYVVNSVTTGPDIEKTTGTVKVDLRATITGPIGSQPCSASTTMPIDTGRAMSCVATLPLPPCHQRRCVYNFSARYFVLARASLSITAILRDLDRSRRRDRGQAACRLPNSFVAGTRVLMADGSHRPIERVEVGDRVRIGEVTTSSASTTDVRRVTHARSARTTEPLVRLTLDVDGPVGDATGSIVSTAGHRFLVVPDRVWTAARDLAPEDRLLGGDGRPVSIVDTTRWPSDGRPVYDLSIQDPHTFFVAAGPVDVLTHNALPPDCGIDAGPKAPPAGTSHTLHRTSPLPKHRGVTYRMDVESNGPGKQGNIHVQFKGKGYKHNEKFTFRPTDCRWVNEAGDVLERAISKRFDEREILAGYRWLDAQPPSCLGGGGQR